MVYAHHFLIRMVIATTKVPLVVLGYKIPTGNLTALRPVMATQGPVAVKLDASLKTFAFFFTGTYYDEQCGMLAYTRCLLQMKCLFNSQSIESGLLSTHIYIKHILFCLILIYG